MGTFIGMSERTLASMYHPLVTQKPSKSPKSHFSCGMVITRPFLTLDLFLAFLHAQNLHQCEIYSENLSWVSPFRFRSAFRGQREREIERERGRERERERALLGIFHNEREREREREGECLFDNGEVPERERERERASLGISVGYPHFDFEVLFELSYVLVFAFARFYALFF